MVPAQKSAPRDNKMADDMNFQQSHGCYKNEPDFRPRSKIRRTSRPMNHIEDIALGELGISYVPAPFGHDMQGCSSSTSYLNLLSIMARVQTPSKKILDSYQKLFSVLDDLNVEVVKEGSRPTARPEAESDDLAWKTAQVRKVYANLGRCFDALNDQERLLENSHSDFVPRHVRALARSYERLLKFMTTVRLVLHRRLTSEGQDKETTKQLILDFAWVFRITFRLISTSPPLILKGKEIESGPDIPELVFEDISAPCSPTGKVLTVAIADIAEVTKQETPPDSSSQHDHPYGQRYHSEVDSDHASLPLSNALCIEHACQLIRALPHTRSRNKDCMLGLVVQTTMVRLTCLVMKEAHLNSLCSPDFDRAEHCDAKVYYTRPYDMFNRADRNHLVHILAAVSSMNKFNKVEFSI